MTAELPTWLDVFLMIFPTLVGTLLGGISGFLIFLFRSVSSVKEDIHKLRLNIALYHMPKKEFKELLAEFEQRINERIDLINRNNKP